VVINTRLIIVKIAGFPYYKSNQILSEGGKPELFVHLKGSGRNYLPEKKDVSEIAITVLFISESTSVEGDKLARPNSY
jgi:hypothetical protein